MDANLQSVGVNGRRLHYVEKGNGQPIIFVHGGLGDYRSWQCQIKSFAQRYHVISYSRRSAYPNQWVGDGMDSTVSNNATDLAELIIRLKLAPAHLVGHSYGAFTAVFCALRHPELARTLVLGEPPIFPLLEENPEDSIELETFKSKAIRPAEEAFHRGEPGNAVRLFLNGVLGREGISDQLLGPFRTMVNDNALSLRGELGSGMVPFTCESAKRILVPSLLIKGELSPKLFHRIIDILARCMPNSEQITIAGVSHDLGRATRAEVFNTEILKFLAKHG